MPPDDVNLDVSFEDVTPAAEPKEETVVVEDSLGNQFLSTIPEQDRPIVGKYVKDWDGKVTKKFMELRGQLKPYQELGELDQVRQAHTFYNHFRTNGEQLFGNMVKAFFEHYGDEAPQKLNALLGVEMPEPQEQQEWDYSQGEPDPNEVFQQNVQKELEELRQFKETQEQASLEMELERQVDSIVKGVHTTRSDIPERFILQGIASGATPEKIISFYDEIRNNGSQQSRPNPPPVMSGQGSIPSGQVDVSKLNAQQRKAYVVQQLAALDQ